MENTIFCLRKYFATALLFLMVFSCSKEPLPVLPEEEELPLQFNTISDKLILTHEFRAAWLTTAWSLDWPQNAKGADQQIALLINQIDRLKASNINVVLFQVRTSSDAFYNSELVPWSHYITGTQGVDPGYDPLQVAIDAAHERGMEMHAWLNPYRVGGNSQYYAPGHPALDYPERYVVFEGARYWNPGLPEVREHICDIVREIIDNYDVDGIHFDDYFYPYGSKVTNPYVFDDRESYLKYGEGMDIHTWREKNIDAMIADVNNTIKSADKSITFGVSPMGTYSNAMTVYANPVTWMNRKIIDYLAPKIYWEIGHSTADFDTHVRFWNAQSAGIAVVPGLAAYKHGDANYPAFANPEQFLSQVSIGRSLTNVKGNCWFRTNHLLSYTLNSFILNRIYQYPSLVPNFSTPGSNPSPPVVTIVNNQLSWAQVEGAEMYAVYSLKRTNTIGEWTANLRQHSHLTSYEGEKGNNYVVIATRGRDKSNYSGVHFIQ